MLLNYAYINTDYLRLGALGGGGRRGMATPTGSGADCEFDPVIPAPRPPGILIENVCPSLRE
jgi:hypothetical protein